MGKQWARQEAKKNELAVIVDRVTLWVKYHPQAAIWGGVAFVALCLLTALFIHTRGTRTESSWSKLAIAASTAYQGQADQALLQIDQIIRDHPTSVAASYARLLEGDIKYDQSKFQEAVKAYQKLVDMPNHKAALPMAMANLGIALEASGDCSTSMATGRRFLETYQDHFLAPPVHASLVRCLHISGRREEAKAALEKMAFLYPQTYWAAWAQARLK